MLFYKYHLLPQVLINHCIRSAVFSDLIQVEPNNCITCIKKFYLGGEEYGRGGEEQGVDAVEIVLGVEALEVDRRRCDHLLPQFELLPQSLDEVGEENDDLLVLFFSRDGTTWKTKGNPFQKPAIHIWFKAVEKSTKKILSFFCLQLESSEISTLTLDTISPAPC